MNRKTTFSIMFFITLATTSLLGYLIGSAISSFFTKRWLVSNTIFLFTFLGFFAGLYLAHKTIVLKSNQNFDEETKNMKFENENNL